MRFLLTSAGITNTTIENALVDLPGKPIAESSALRIPTGVQPFPGGPPCYWMRQSGLADTLPSLRRETVYVGTSGGAMVATPDFGGETDDSEPLTGSE